ncbi:DUF4157 domain-containing protein [Nostoc sp. PCC 7107]|uniref:eCIS core domain-containing protein n=1 Tax=Nostoc sp. PCC 7107 TaxID=317936 RepID=UPI0005C9C3C5|nr:DUF4157 domain-containing protein [Nostoc sp. PCC 7107]
MNKVQRQESTGDEDELQMKSISGNIQRQEMPEDEDKLQMKPIVQRLSSAGGMTATPDLEESIQQARSSGQPLTESIRQPMEQAFGADFSGVRIHSDSQSDQLNQSLQARAFTTGRDVFFRQGEYDPGSQGGQELLAHELTHVVQQNGIGVLGQESFSSFSAQRMVVQTMKIKLFDQDTIDTLLKTNWQTSKDELETVKTQHLEPYCETLEMMKRMIKAFKKLEEFQEAKTFYSAQEMDAILVKSGAKELQNDLDKKRQNKIDKENQERWDKLKQKTPGIDTLKTLSLDGQVNRVIQTQTRKKLDKNNFLDSYRIEFTGFKNPNKSIYFDAWYAHFHFESDKNDSQLICGHLKTEAEQGKGGGAVFRSVQTFKKEQMLEGWCRKTASS